MDQLFDAERTIDCLKAQKSEVKRTEEVLTKKAHEELEYNKKKLERQLVCTLNDVKKLEEKNSLLKVSPKNMR